MKIFIYCEIPKTGEKWIQEHDVDPTDHHHNVIIREVEQIHTSAQITHITVEP